MNPGRWAIAFGIVAGFLSIEEAPQQPTQTTAVTDDAQSPPFWTAPILQYLQVVATRGRARLAVSVVGWVNIIDFAAANIVGKAESALIAASASLARKRHPESLQAAETSDLQQDYFNGVNIGGPMRIELDVARDAIFVPPLRRFCDSFGDVAVFLEHAVFRLRKDAS